MIIYKWIECKKCKSSIKLIFNGEKYIGHCIVCNKEIIEKAYGDEELIEEQYGR